MKKKSLITFLLGTFIQIWSVCIIVYILRNRQVDVNYSTLIGIVAIAIGGSSSALWGTIICVKYKKIRIKEIICELFKVKQDFKNYLLMILFLSVDFFYVAYGGKINIAVWYLPIMMFFKHLLIGGIEEIGWRYFYQSELQKSFSYVVSTFITFISWGIWHYSYLYIEGTLPKVDLFAFFIGLLTNCFILSALYNKTHNLCLCVITHSWINVLSQLVEGGNEKILYVSKLIIILMAIVISSKNSSTKSLRE